MTKNKMTLEHMRAITVPSDFRVLPDQYLVAALKELNRYGFTFSESLIGQVRTLSVEIFTQLYKEILGVIKEMVGAHVTHRPMYKNFPEDVMEMSDTEMYLRATLHYVSTYVRVTSGDIEGTQTPSALPEIPVKERFPLLERVDLKIIELTTDVDIHQYIHNLISSKTSISEGQKEFISWAIAHYDHIDTLLPDSIPLKENVGFVVAQLIKMNRAPLSIRRYFHTATDVLRLLVSLSEGDVSLSTPSRFKNFTRKERKLALSLLEKCGNITEDMLRYQEMWKRAGEKLHPGEYADRYPTVVAAFDVIRKGLAFETFGSRVEKGLLRKEIADVAKLLESRPGEYARRLDHLLREAGDQKQEVIQGFQKVVHDISTPVLLAVEKHFATRNEQGKSRHFFPKGNVAKMMVVENTLPLLEQSMCDAIVDICSHALIERFTSLPSLGKVYIDPKLANYHVPFAMRSASKSLRTLIRGTRVPLGEGTDIRSFVYWHEGIKANGQHTGYIDVDSNFAFYDENWNHKGQVTYYSLKLPEAGAYHSGDITSAPKGASEFLDVNMNQAKKYGIRYIVMTIHSFSGTPFNEMPQCFAGFMMRQNPKQGEIFEASTVVDKFDVASESQISIPFIIDLETKEMIWCDLALSRIPEGANNVEQNKIGIAAMAKAMVSLKKPNLHHLFTLHASARSSEIVQKKEEADTVFSVEEGITPFDIDVIVANYL